MVNGQGLNLMANPTIITLTEQLDKVRDEENSET